MEDACGSDKCFCFRMDGDDFSNHSVGTGLALRLDSQSHGVLEPSFRMDLGIYRQHLSGTRAQWSVDEQ